MIHIIPFLAVLRSLLGVQEDQELNLSHWKKMGSQSFADSMVSRFGLPKVCFYVHSALLHLFYCASIAFIFGVSVHWRAIAGEDTALEKQN